MRKYILALLLACSLASAAAAGSDVPPEGPPWKRDFVEAQREALKSGKPLFLYFTKTY